MGKLIVLLTPTPLQLAQSIDGRLGHDATWALPSALWFPDLSMATHWRLYQCLHGRCDRGPEADHLQATELVPYVNRSVKVLAPSQRCLLAYGLALAAGRGVIIAVAVGEELTLAAQASLARFLKTQMRENPQSLLYLTSVVTPLAAMAHEVWQVHGEQVTIWMPDTLPPVVLETRHIQLELKSPQAADDLIQTMGASWGAAVTRPTPQKVVGLVRGEQQLFDIVQAAGAQLQHLTVLPTPVTGLSLDLSPSAPPRSLTHLLTHLPQTPVAHTPSCLSILPPVLLYEIKRFLKHGQNGEIDYFLVPIVLQLVAYTAILNRLESASLPIALSTLGFISGALPLLLSADAFHRWHWPTDHSLRTHLNRTPVGRQEPFAICFTLILAHSLITLIYSWPLILIWLLDPEGSAPGPALLSWFSTTILTLGIVALLGRWQSRLGIIRLITYLLWSGLWIAIVVAPTLFVLDNPITLIITLSLSVPGLALALWAWA